MFFVAFAYAGQSWNAPSTAGTAGQSLVRSATAGLTEWATVGMTVPGSGAELLARATSTTMVAVTGSSVSGADVALAGNLGVGGVASYKFQVHVGGISRFDNTLAVAGLLNFISGGMQVQFDAASIVRYLGDLGFSDPSGVQILTLKDGGISIGHTGTPVGLIDVVRTTVVDAARFTVKNDDASWVGVRYGWAQGNGTNPYGFTYGGYNASGNKLIRMNLDGSPAAFQFISDNDIFQFTGRLQTKAGIIGENHTDLNIILNTNSLGGTRGIKFKYNGGSNTAFAVYEDSTAHASGKLSCDVGISAGPVTFAVLNASTPTATLGVYRITDRNNRLAYPDGTNWRFVSDDAIIS